MRVWSFKPDNIRWKKPDCENLRVRLYITGPKSDIFNLFRTSRKPNIS